MVEALLVEALRRGGTVRLIARGRSMEPTLPDGATVVVRPLRRRPRAGEIVAVTRPDGGLALHRVIAWHDDGSVTTWGDALPAPDDWGPCVPLGVVKVVPSPVVRSWVRRAVARIRVVRRLVLHRHGSRSSARSV
jgi:hypothetical protein